MLFLQEDLTKLSKTPIPLTACSWLPGKVTQQLSQAKQGMDCSSLWFFWTGNSSCLTLQVD